MIDRVRGKRAVKPARSVATQVSQASPFGEPALLPGEDAKAYRALLARFRAAVNPRDVVDEELVRDAANDTWMIGRLRRYQMALLRVLLPEALEGVLAPLRDFPPGDDLVAKWARGEADAVEEVKRLLAAANLTADAVWASAFAKNIAVFESFECLIAAATARRERTLRELERRRGGLDRDRRRAFAQIEAEPASGSSA